MRPKTWLTPIAIALVAAAALSGQLARAEDKDDDEAQVAAKDLKDAKVSLEDALKASEAQGTPISAKFELEKGKLQLSVYTAKGDKFSEVLVDYKTGKVVKTEAIDGGDDLKAAQVENAAMGKAKDTLRAAVGKAVAANKGFRAVSAMPKLDGDHPVAQITLVKGAESHNVTQKLD
jgi:hypothetical protein